MKYKVQIETITIYEIEVDGPDAYGDGSAVHSAAWQVWDGDDKSGRRWVDTPETYICQILDDAGNEMQL